MRTGVELPGKVGMNNLETNSWEKNGLGIKWNGWIFLVWVLFQPLVIQKSNNLLCNTHGSLGHWCQLLVHQAKDIPCPRLAAPEAAAPTSPAPPPPLSTSEASSAAARSFSFGTPSRSEAPTSPFHPPPTPLHRNPKWPMSRPRPLRWVASP